MRLRERSSRKNNLRLLGGDWDNSAVEEPVKSVRDQEERPGGCDGTQRISHRVDKRPSVALKHSHTPAKWVDDAVDCVDENVDPNDNK